jgi:hypothetical protein
MAHRRRRFVPDPRGRCTGTDRFRAEEHRRNQGAVEDAAAAGAEAKAAGPRPGASAAGGDAGREKIVLLLRNTLIGLNDALQTGNFTVFRERSAPGFQSANSPERLAQAFADLAARRVDLSTVSVTTPQLSANPELDQAKGMLHLKGYFPLRPSPIAFEVLYQSVDGRWRLFGISVQPAAPPPQAATRMPSPPPDQN